MLTNYPIFTMIPVVDINRAKSFYINKLGLKLVNEMMPGIALFSAGENTQFLLFQRDATRADHTIAAFTVDDVEKVVQDLTNSGVIFEQYDLGNGVKTDEMGIATMGPAKSAWFKDTEGNILSIVNKQ